MPEIQTHDPASTDTPSSNGLAAFFRENWLWIVVPVVLVLGGLFVLITMMDGGDADAPFIYNIF
jgi:hypothetical protein